MEGDEYFCKACKNKWKEEKSGTAFCHSCYSRDIVNISEKARDDERKQKDEEAAKKRKDERIQREKEYRSRLLKNRDVGKHHYRGKN